MRFAALLVVLCVAAPLTLAAQWQIQDAHITADLRGIDYVGNGVAWASGSNGTVLRTEDMGFVWQLCTTPPGAEHLDFRGIQAFDNNTAIVMSSGKGDLSRLYKTTDGCQTWKLLLTNPDKDGFWDALVFHDRDAGEIVGDPVRGRFFVSSQLGSRALKAEADLSAPRARDGEAVFAASNSAVLSFGRLDYMIGTGGVPRSRVIFFREPPDQPGSDSLHFEQESAEVPVGTGRASSGIFSLAYGSGQPLVVGGDSYQDNRQNGVRQSLVAVGGDYLKPDDFQATAASSEDRGKHWTAATTPPHGYRSAVAYDKAHNTWITVGPNGTDISTDDGRNWHALKPDPKYNDTPDADQHWNALSLPFVVGPHGRIGILRESALQSPATNR